jgi:hypothetical protein
MKFLILALLYVFLHYNSSVSTKKINVHVVPHSHDDAGWLSTVDDYFTGKNYKKKCVQCILDSMIISLSADSKRTFTYAEMIFFERWYKSLPQVKKEQVKHFVKTGQLEFANGGWVMNDEATTHYQHIIDQMRLGMEFLKNEFGYVPKVAWYLDPFGHSISNAYILQELGFERLVMVRIDHNEKKKRIKEKTLEFFWNPSSSGNLIETQTNPGIFTHVTHGHYSPEENQFGEFFEIQRNITTIKEQLPTIFNYFKTMSNAYLTQELLFLYGDDFTFKNPHQNYENVEHLMNLFRMDPFYKDKINIFYSSPNKYFDAVDKYQLAYPTLQNVDFFPYSDISKDYWTGYYSSRPCLKGLVRDAGRFLEYTNMFLFNQVISNSISRFQLNPLLNKINILRRELALAQHHDAVAGTAREEVSQDYIKRLQNGIRQASTVLKTLTEENLNEFISSLKYDSVCLENSASQVECMSKVYSISQLIKGIIFIYLNPNSNNGKTPIKYKIKNPEDQDLKLMSINSQEEIPFDLICDEDLKYCEVIATVDLNSMNNLYTIIKLQLTALKKKYLCCKRRVSIYNMGSKNLIFRFRNKTNY